MLMAAVSCSKNETVTTIDKPDTVNLISAADLYYYTADTTAEISRHDTMFYNSDLKIEKVLSIMETVDTVISLFTYNSHGDMTKCSVSANFENDFYNMDFLFYYDSQNRLDSMIRKGASESIVFRFSYDENSHVKQMYSYYLASIYSNYYAGSINAEAAYYRNSSGLGMDSIYTGMYSSSSEEQVFDVRTWTYLTSATTVAADEIDRSYLFMMAWQFESYIVDRYQNVYWHQFVNPDIPLLRSGNYSYAYDYGSAYSGKAFDFSAVRNVDNTVRWLKLSQVMGTGTTTYMNMNKLTYTKVVKN